MSRHVAFFATRDDWLDLLLPIEKRSPLMYVLDRSFPKKEATTYESAADIPDLGTSTHGSKGDIRYLVLPQGTKLKFRKCGGRGGVEVRYIPAPPGGDTEFVYLAGGGDYDGECFIAAYIETASERREGLRFYDRFYRAIRKRFVTIGTGYRNLIGPNALELLRAGMRFTDDASSPRQLDKKLPRGWKRTKRAD